MRVLVILIAGLVLCSVQVSAQKRVGGKLLKGYDAIYPFKNGRAKVEKKGKVGYIDMTGTEIIECVYDAIYPFEKGVAKVEKVGKFGMINESGEILIEALYDYIGPPSPDGVMLLSRQGRRGIVKVTGNTPDNVEYIVDIRD
jgi:hypothetical protein